MSGQTAGRSPSDLWRRHAGLLAVRFGDLLEALPDAILLIDGQGRILLATTLAQSLSGFERDALLGEPVEVLVPPSDREAHAAYRRRHWDMAAGARAAGPGLRTAVLRRDGREVPVEITLSPLETEAGRFIMCALRDVTERRRAEQALEEANQELEAFAWSISHDLRAPLRAIDGFARALDEDFGMLLPPEGREHLAFIHDGAQRLSLLIDELLRFSRLSSQPLTRLPVDMTALVQSALDELAPMRRGRSVEVRLHPLADCVGDAALLKQVWLNLLENAFKYSRNQERAIVEVGSASGEAGPIYYVRDNGAGFDMRYAERLFGVFQRLHRADEFEGTGVGLALVKRIIRRHGGRVWAESAPEQGATFRFLLDDPPCEDAGAASTTLETSLRTV